MTSTPARREHSTFADLFDWVESGLPALPMFRPFAGSHVIRVEENLEAGQYGLRAELPGIDPDKDVEISVENGVLTVAAERREEKKEPQRSEFRYGRFSRSITLPVRADEDDVKATYRDGILEVRVGITEKSTPETKRIPITKG
jgi:HSP20 family protein